MFDEDVEDHGDVSLGQKSGQQRHISLRDRVLNPIPLKQIVGRKTVLTVERRFERSPPHLSCQIFFATRILFGHGPIVTFWSRCRCEVMGTHHSVAAAVSLEA